MNLTKHMRINLLLVLICLSSLKSSAQTTTILSFGFETNDVTWTYNQTTGVTLARANNNANTGTWSAFFDGANGAGARINGSVITPSLTFEPGYIYTVSVFAKTNATGAVTGQNPVFKIARATTATNAAMSAATGADLLLNTTLTSASYGSAFSASFSVTSNTTRFIGFHASSNINSVDAYIDDVTITRTCNISANAGPDQVSAATCGLTQLNLAGNTLPTGVSGAWTVSAGTGGSFGNTASPTSTFSGTSGNAYTLQWTVSLGTCTSVSDQVNVTLNSAPVIGACPGDIVQCDNNVATWTDPTATGTPNPTVSCSPASGSTFATGTTTVTCTASNFCGTSTCSFSVTINTSPVITCPADITTCNPVVTFTPTATGSPAPSVSCTPASGSTFAVGTTQVNCTASNSCNNSTCSFNVTVNEAPVIGACPSDITQCDNAVATWTDPTASGTPAPTVTCSPASGSTFATGTTTVTCTATNSCGSSSCSFSVTINTSPVITCPADIVSCNTVVTFSPAVSGSPAPAVTCTPASGSTFTVGTTQVNCSAVNSCNTSTCSFNVTVNEAPVISACPSDISQCDNNIATWTDPTATGTPAATVTCVPSSGSTFSNGTTVVTCTATNSCGSSSCSFNVSIGNSPTVDAGPNQTICYTGTATMNGSFGGGASSVTWSTLGDGSFDNVNLVNAVYTPGPNDISSGTATLVLTSDAPGSCIAATDQMTLSLIYTPTAQPGPVTGATPACPGNTITYSISPVSGATSYSWSSVDATTTIVNGQGTTSVDILFGNLPNGQSTYPLSVTAVNQCGNSLPRTFSPRGKISQPSFSGSSPSVICPNTNGVVFTVNPVAGAASYSWSITGAGATIVGPTNGTSVTVDFGTYTSVSINVTASNACMTTLPRSKTVSASPAVPGTIVGQSYPCPNGTYTYSVAPVTGASTYNWTAPAGSVVTGNSNSVSITFGSSIPGGSIVSVIAVGSCSNQSGVRSKGVASGIPNIPSNISGSASGQCGQSGVSYSVVPNSNQPLATGYTWSVNNGATIAGPNNFSAVSVDFPANFNQVVVSVIASNGCGNSGNRNLVVSGAPSVPTSITGNAAPCAGTIETYCATGSAGATNFVWTIPQSWTVMNTSPPCITVLTGSNGGNITCRGNNACGNSSAKTKPVSISCRQGQVLQTDAASALEVYPNPANDKAMLRFISEDNSEYVITLMEMTGNTVYNTTHVALQGENHVELDLNRFAKGIYMVQLANRNGQQMTRLVIE